MVAFTFGGGSCRRMRRQSGSRGKIGHGSEYQRRGLDDGYVAVGGLGLLFCLEGIGKRQTARVGRVQVVLVVVVVKIIGLCIWEGHGQNTARASQMTTHRTHTAAIVLVLLLWMRCDTAFPKAVDIFAATVLAMDSFATVVLCCRCIFGESTSRFVVITSSMTTEIFILGMTMMIIVIVVVTVTSTTAGIIKDANVSIVGFKHGPYVSRTIAGGYGWCDRRRRRWHAMQRRGTCTSWWKMTVVVVVRVVVGVRLDWVIAFALLQRRHL